MFLGPWDAGAPWNPHGIEGLARFFKGVWKLCQMEAPETVSVKTETEKQLRKTLHQTIKKTGEDLEHFRFNTAIAALMSLRNVLKSVPEAAGSDVWQKCLEGMLLMLAPIAPHITEELWQKIKPDSGSIHQQAWPEYDESLIVEEMVTMVVQINGKVRDRIEMTAGINKEEAQKAALEAPKVQSYLEGMQISKVIVVPERLVNIVCG